MQVGANTTFKQIYDQMKPGPLTNESKHLRLDGTKLYTHNSLMPHGKGAAALVARDAKYEGVAATIKQAITKEHGAGVADAVFANLGLATGHGSSVKLSDLRNIKAEIANLTTVDVSRYAGSRKNEAMLDAAISKSDPGLATALEGFLKKNYAEVNLDFLRAVHDYEREPTDDKARDIVANFFDGGPNQINPSDRASDAKAMFDGARDALGSNGADSKAFDRLREEVHYMTAHDLMPRFLSAVADGRV